MAISNKLTPDEVALCWSDPAARCHGGSACHKWGCMAVLAAHLFVRHSLQHAGLHAIAGRGTSARMETPLLLAPLLPIHGLMELDAEALNNRMCMTTTCSSGHGGGWDGRMHLTAAQQHPQEVRTWVSTGHVCLVPRGGDPGHLCLSAATWQARGLYCLAQIRVSLGCCDPEGAPAAHRQLFCLAVTSATRHGLCDMCRWCESPHLPPRSLPAGLPNPPSRSCRPARLRAQRTACLMAPAHPQSASHRHSKVLNRRTMCTKCPVCDTSYDTPVSLCVTSRTITKPLKLHCARILCTQYLRACWWCTSWDDLCTTNTATDRTPRCPGVLTVLKLVPFDISGALLRDERGAGSPHGSFAHTPDATTQCATVSDVPVSVLLVFTAGSTTAVHCDVMHSSV